jgi:perosamine synthetase
LIQLTEPCFDAEEERAVAAVIRSGWVTQGPRVAEFEQRFAEGVGAAQGVAVTSATTALFLSMHSLGIGPGDEVIVPSATFIASVNVVVHLGATPVLVDVLPDTYNLDPEGVAEAIGPRTRAVMVVHQLGQPADLDAIQAIAEEHRIHVVEDAACAVGSRYRGRYIGSSQNLCCFSFHPRKVMVTGEGGMITTSDSDVAQRLRRLRHQGMGVSDAERHRSGSAAPESYDEVGYNFRMTDLQAAIGIVQLGKLESFVERRRALAARYDAALADGPLVPPRVPQWAHWNYQSYPVRWRDATRERRDALLDELMRRGVSCRRGLMAVHREAPYRRTGLARVVGSLEKSEAVDAQTLVLPIYPRLSDADQDRVIEAIHSSIVAVGE